MSEACLFLYEAFGYRKGEAQWETRFWQYESKEDVRMRVTTRHSLFNTLLVGMALLWIFSGCTHRETILESRTEISPVETKVAPRTAEIVHTVQWSGEYLSLIAKWYTGSSSNWKTLAEANPELNPNSIQIGQKILIPKTLAKTEEPMPRSFLPPSPSNSGRDKSPPSDQPVPEEVLYAPI
jgi:LysM repeat protein